MKIAVIADIHSNYLALENVLCLVNELHPDAILFLGDYLTDFPYPQKTLRLLDECAAHFPCSFVRGNREDYLIRRRDIDEGWQYSSSSGSLLYTYENLTKTDLDKLAALPMTLDLALPGQPILTACHASPHGTKEWIMNRPNLIDRYTKEINGAALVCGHTHRGGLAEANRKRVIFCPSVGLPQDHRPGAKFLILEPKNGSWRYRTYSVDFDKKKMLSEFEKSGLLEKAGVWAHCIIKSMQEEHDYSAHCVALAWKKATQDGFRGSSVLPERYWIEAATELSII